MKIGPKSTQKYLSALQTKIRLSNLFTILEPSKENNIVKLKRKIGPRNCLDTVYLFSNLDAVLFNSTNTSEYALECRPPQGSCLQQVLFTHFSIFKLYKERPS